MTAVAGGDELRLEVEHREGDGLAGLLFHSHAYQVFVDGGTVEVVFTPPFDTRAGSQVRALVRVARDLGMDVRARVARAAAPGPAEPGPGSPPCPADPGP